MKGKSYYEYQTKKTDKYKSGDYYNYRYNYLENDGEEELIDPYSVLNVSAFQSIEEVRTA